MTAVLLMPRLCERFELNKAVALLDLGVHLFILFCCSLSFDFQGLKSGLCPEGSGFRVTRDGGLALQNHAIMSR